MPITPLPGAVSGRNTDPEALISQLRHKQKELRNTKNQLAEQEKHAESLGTIDLETAQDIQKPPDEGTHPGS